MGTDIFMYLVKDNKIVKNDIYKGRDSEWFQHLQGDGWDDIYDELPRHYGVSPQAPLSLEKKANIYFTKLQEIDKENEEKEKKEKLDEENQIEFGIDENNPYFTDNEDNVPECHIKFTSSQFNQFTYILFKNFEAKFIVSDEANNKIIIPFNKL